MKTAVLTEFSVAKPLLVQMSVVYLFVGIVLGVFMESVYAMTACIAAMTPFMLLFTCAAYDSTNGWERFRAALPTTRAGIVVGRYALVLVGSVAECALGCLIAFSLGNLAPLVPFFSEDLAAKFAGEIEDIALVVGSGISGASLIMVVVSIMLPLIMRFGMNTAMRVVPIALALIIPASATLLPQFVEEPQFFMDALNWVQSNTELTFALVAAGTLVLYAISCAVAVALYRNKEL